MASHQARQRPCWINQHAALEESLQHPWLLFQGLGATSASKAERVSSSDLDEQGRDSTTKTTTTRRSEHSRCVLPLRGPFLTVKTRLHRGEGIKTAGDRHPLGCGVLWRVVEDWLTAHRQVACVSSRPATSQCHWVQHPASILKRLFASPCTIFFSWPTRCLCCYLSVCVCVSWR